MKETIELEFERKEGPYGINGEITTHYLLTDGTLLSITTDDWVDDEEMEQIFGNEVKEDLARIEKRLERGIIWE